MYFGFGFFFFILEGSTCYVRTFFLGKPLSDAPPMERYLKVLKFPYAMLLSWEIWPCRAHCTPRLMIIKISTYAKWENGWSKINEIFRNAFNDLKSLNFNKVPQKNAWIVTFHLIYFCSYLILLIFILIYISVWRWDDDGTLWDNKSLDWWTNCQACGCNTGKFPLPHITPSP